MSSEYESSGTEETCDEYTGDLIISDVILTSFFFFGIYFPLLFIFRVYTSIYETINLRLNGILVQGCVVRQRRIVVQSPHRRRVGQEVFFVTIKYPANSSFSQDCVKDFEVSPWTYAVCLEDPHALAIVRDKNDPRISKLSHQVFGCYSPLCVVFSFLVYGIFIGFIVMWNVMLYKSDVVCHAPIWSVPLAVAGAIFTRKRELQSRNRARVTPSEVSVPEASIVPAVLNPTDDATIRCSSTRVISPRAIGSNRFLTVVPVADAVVSVEDSKASTDDEDVPVAALASNASDDELASGIFNIRCDTDIDRRRRIVEEDAAGIHAGGERTRHEIVNSRLSLGEIE